MPMIWALIALLLLSPSFALQVHLERDYVRFVPPLTKVNLYVYNDESKELELFVSPNIPFFITVRPYYFTLSPNSSKVVELVFTGQIPRGVYEYWITVSERKNSGFEEVWKGRLLLKSEAPVEHVEEEKKERTYLLVKTEKSIYIPGDSIKITLITSPNAIPGSVIVSIERNGKPILTYSRQLTEPMAVISFPLPQKMLPGVYKLSVSVEGKKYLSNYTSFEVKEVEKVDVSKEYSKKLLSKTTKVIIKNSGNVEVKGNYSESFWVWEAVFAEFKEKPAKIEKSGLKVKYVWNYSLKPWEEASITYTLDYSPYFLLLLIVLLSLILVLQRARWAEVKKTYEVVEENRIKVRIDVKNRTGRALEGAVLEDVVPGIGVPGKFLIKPSRKEKLPMGIKLIWKLGRLEPFEERIITYEIRTSLGIVGEFELPKPKLRFKVGDKELLVS